MVPSGSHETLGRSDAGENVPNTPRPVVKIRMVGFDLDQSDRSFRAPNDRARRETDGPRIDCICVVNAERRHEAILLTLAVASITLTGVVITVLLLS